MADLYRVLGVERDADPDRIKKAYKRLVRQYHPDVNKSPGAADRFQEIKKAYEVLSDPEDRKMYDHYGDMMLQEGFRPDTGSSTWSDSGAGSFESFFQGFTGESSSFYENESYTWDRRSERTSSGYASTDFGFGGSSRRTATSDFQPPERGTDIHVSLRLSTLEAIRGCEKKVQLRRPSRWKRGSSVEGISSEIVIVQIPPNTLGGTEIKLQGKGNFGKGGGADGNLVVKVDVHPSSQLFREGENLYLIVPITLQEALTGAKLELPTLGKSIKVRIPENVRMGQKLRVKERGAPKQGGGFGDLYLILYPVAPVGSDPALRELASSLDRFYDPQGIRKNLRFE